MKQYVLLSCILVAVSTAFCDDYYTGPQVYQMRPGIDKEMALDCIGATGIKARFYPGVLLTVEGFTEQSPAKNQLAIGDVITAVNRTSLKGQNPFVTLGQALNQAEAEDGKIVFTVQSNAEAAREVEISIQVLGSYSDTWPLECEKSRRIIKRAAEYYATNHGFREKYFNDKSENGGVPSALACLFLLSTGDDAYLPMVKEYFEGFPKELSKIGDHTWNNGYNGIACAEYYLRTGDRQVLPILQYYCDDARDRQCFESSWGHWGRSISPRYVAGGLMNPAGCQVLTTLLLAKECGVDVDEETLLGALKFWYRFAGHGTVPYGDHRPEGGLGSNGKDGMSAAAMRVASYATGNASTYEQAMKSLSMATLTSYPSMIRGHADEGRGDGIWRGVASSYMLDYKPDQYHGVMNRVAWWYDLSRRPSGAIGMAGCQRFDDVGSGAGVALAYTAPLKTLRITGAPRADFASDFKLPRQIWGNKTDLAFLSIEHNRRYHKLGEEDPVHVPFFAFGSAYSKAGGLSDVPRTEIMKNIHHKRYMIRTQAAKALRTVGALDELASLLHDKDPRVRRAALDGMSDYRYWFHIGKTPIKADQFTPSMIKSVTAILRNKQESLWVIDGALMVMGLMPPETVGTHLDLITPWTKSEEWWLRQSAFTALATAATDADILPAVLPTMLDMLVAENHTQPRETMTRRLDGLLKQHGATSPQGQQILGAHMAAVQNRKIVAGQRAGEGEYDVLKSAEVLFRETPAQALPLARTLNARSDELSTGMLVQITRHILKEMDSLSIADRLAMTALLYGAYRENLVERLKQDKGNLGLVDTILALTALQNPDAGWQDIGAPAYTERLWHFTSFEPEGDDIQHQREKKRFRDLALPDTLKRWHEPSFDAAAWPSGKAPIGKGEFKKRGGVAFNNESAWGDGEFVFARTTFTVDALDYDYYRISVLANQGFRIYLNGTPIHTYIWWKNDPEYRKIMLTDQISTLLKKGTNHLAVYAGSDYVTGAHVGQIDVLIEGLREDELLGTAKTP